MNENEPTRLADTNLGPAADVTSQGAELSSDAAGSTRSLVPGPRANAAAGSGADPAPEPADPAVPTWFGHYRVLRQIGAGGMGAVYLAEDTKLGRRAAIKTMRPGLAARKENRDRFVREARAAAAVEHDNIVPVWEVGEASDGSPFIAMPFLQGETLDARLRRDRVLPVPLVVALGWDVAAALAAAHAKGVVHRDVKPANVWLEGDPGAADPARQVRRAKVLDFGLARAADHADTHVTAPGAVPGAFDPAGAADPADAELTAPGAVLGTPAYMSPEQAAGGAVDHRSDLWSLGVTLYRMATGRLPFTGSNSAAVLRALASGEPPDTCAVNPEVPPGLGELIGWLLQKDPDRRPQGAEEVAARLCELAVTLGAVPVGSVPTAPSPWEQITEEDRTEPPGPRAGQGAPRRWAMAAAGVVALAVLGGLVAGAVSRLGGGRGTLTVEVDGPEAEARFRGGQLVLSGPDGRARYAVAGTERTAEVGAGRYAVRIEGAEGLALDAGEVVIERNGAATVRIELAHNKVGRKEPSGPRADPGPDRKAAEWVLDIGERTKAVATVHLDGGPEIRSIGALPDGPLTLTAVVLNSCGDSVTDAGLKNLRECRELTSVFIWSAPVTDTGAEHLSNLTKLRHLVFGATRLTDAGLRHFKGLTKLRALHVNDTKITNTGLAELKDLAHITSFHLDRTKVTGAGLAPFKGSKTLREVGLNGTLTMDADAVHLAALPALEILGLLDTQLGNDGLAALTALKRLAHLRVSGTRVTPDGVKRFAADMPQCQIFWDGGTIEPTVRVDEPAVAWVLRAGGRATVAGPWDVSRSAVSKPSDLPAGLVTLVEVNALGPKVEGGDLSNLLGTRLERVWLNGTRVGDDGLELLARIPTLEWLMLDETPITDRGVGHLAALTRLERLELSGTPVTDAGLTHLKALPALNYLGLRSTRVTDAGLAHLKDFPALTTVILDRTAVTDAGLAPLKAVPGLRVCGVSGTKVTEAGVKAFARAVPRCKITWDGGVIEPTAK
jgi:serine/threonine protein kinase